MVRRSIASGVNALGDVSLQLRRRRPVTDCCDGTGMKRAELRVRIRRRRDMRRRLPRVIVAWVGRLGLGASRLPRCMTAAARDDL